MHPAAVMPFDDLLAGLLAEVERGNIVTQAHPTLPLTQFTYSRQCTYERQWNVFTEIARGLILDISAKAIVALPFPKFFNCGERPDTLVPNEPFEVFEKLDGSLIIVFWYRGEWHTATKGSFISEQAQWAKGQLATIRPEAQGVTWLFEAIYRANKIVVPYDFEGLVYLGGYEANGNEITTNFLDCASQMLGWRTAKRVKIDSLGDLVAKAETLPAMEEGWVVRYASGLRLKIKGAEYLRLHRAISRLSPLSVWELMAHGADLEGFRRELPEEFWPDFDRMVFLLRTAKISLEQAVEVAYHSRGCAELSDKSVGLMLPDFPDPIRGLIFPYRKSGGLIGLDLRARRALFAHIRPTGNRLEGYTPSSSIVRAQEEAL